MKVILLDGLVIFHVTIFCKISVCLLFLSLVPKRGIAPGCKWLDMTTCSVSSALVTFPMCLCALGHYLGDFGWQRVLWDVGSPCGFPLTIQQLNSYLSFFFYAQVSWYLLPWLMGILGLFGIWKILACKFMHDKMLLLGSRNAL